MAAMKVISSTKSATGWITLDATMRKVYDFVVHCHRTPYFTAHSCITHKVWDSKVPQCYTVKGKVLGARGAGLSHWPSSSSTYLNAVVQIYAPFLSWLLKSGGGKGAPEQRRGFRHSETQVVDSWTSGRHNKYANAELVQIYEPVIFANKMSLPYPQWADILRPAPLSTYGQVWKLCGSCGDITLRKLTLG